MQNTYLKIFTVLLLSVAIIGCESSNNTPVITAATAPSVIKIKRYATIWERMADEFTIPANQNNPRVQKFIKSYTRENSYYLIKYSEQSKPYLYHVVSMLEERGMPVELALLPIVESEYRPYAKSNMGASGLWQLAALTGRLYGLKQDSYFDGRRDVTQATRAALGHLQYLYERFDNDWLLALAAYNAGHVRVEQAIKRNKQLGKPTDYWSLSLPKETQNFVPKFLALVYLVKNSQKLNINLARVPNKPYFAEVKLDSQINLQQAAKFAEVDVADLKLLNSGYRTHVTPPKGPHQILLPVQKVSTFKANLSTDRAAKASVQAQAKQAAQTTTTKSKSTSSTTKLHVVKNGDTLTKISDKYKVSIKTIKNKNNLKSDTINIGQRLSI